MKKLNLNWIMDFHLVLKKIEQEIFYYKQSH